MVKTSKIVPQEEKASSSQSAADKAPVDPRPKECVPAAYVLTSDFKLDKGSTASVSVPKPVKKYKRKRASVPEDQKPKKWTARKPKKNTIPLTVESVLRLRDEDEEEEEDDGSVLANRMKKSTDAPKAAKSMVIHKVLPRTEEISEGSSGRVPKSLEIKDASYQSQRTAVAVHREVCSQSRAELHRFETDLQRVTEERNSIKLLLGQMGKEIEDLRAELAKAHQDQADLSEQVMILLKAYGLDTGTMANFSVSQLQQKIKMIGKLREEVDVIKTESLKWEEGMDRFVTEKEAARAQLSLAENQVQSIKEKSSVQVRRIEELEARLASELAKDDSDAEKAKADADAFVAVYRADAEAAHV
ncbi:uncharacterized protein [Nicotiana tomentosiformis]|uniref:uncharacterized protein n=1 Tax=Nicotiana tomentosiformis TaxID=4098 RepID=UPI00388C76D1